MTLNIRDIINAVGCDEARAVQIERGINNQYLLDWSECEMSDLISIAKQINKELP